MLQFFQAHYCFERSDVPVDALDHLLWKNINSLLHKHHHCIFAYWRTCHLDNAVSFMPFTNGGHLIGGDQSCASYTHVKLTRSINSLDNIKIVIILLFGWSRKRLQNKMVCFFVSLKYGVKFCLLNWLRSHLSTTNVFIVLDFFFVSFKL